MTVTYDGREMTGKILSVKTRQVVIEIESPSLGSTPVSLAKSKLSSYSRKKLYGEETP